MKYDLITDLSGQCISSGTLEEMRLVHAAFVTYGIRADKLEIVPQYLAPTTVEEVDTPSETEILEFEALGRKLYAQARAEEYCDLHQDTKDSCSCE